MRNITTGEKGAKAGVDARHKDITVLRKARHPIRIHDVIYMLLHSGYTILVMNSCVKGKGMARKMEKDDK